MRTAYGSTLTIKRQMSRRKGGPVSLVETVNGEGVFPDEGRMSITDYLKRKLGGRKPIAGKLAEVLPAEEDQTQKLTLRRTWLILKCVYTLSAGHRSLMLKCFFVSAWFAFFGAIADLPAQYILDFAAHKGDYRDVQYQVFMNAAGAFLVIVTLANLFLPGVQLMLKAKMQTMLSQAMCMNAIMGRLFMGPVKHIQPRLQLTRDRVPEVAYSMSADFWFYIRAILILGYFVRDMFPIMPGFVLAAIGGILLYGLITYVIGVLMSDLYDRKQKAHVTLSDRENEILGELDKARNETMVVFNFFRGIKDTKENFDKLLCAWDDYTKAYIGAEVLLIKVNTFVRDLVLEVTKITSLLILAGYTYDGVITPGAMPLLVGLIPKGAEIFTLYSGLQKKLLDAQFFVKWVMDATPQEQ